MKAAGATGGDVVVKGVGVGEDAAAAGEVDADGEVSLVVAEPADLESDALDRLASTTMVAAMAVTTTVAMPNRRAELCRGRRLWAADVARRLPLSISGFTTEDASHGT